MLLLLLFNTHAGGNLTFYFFGSHLATDFIRGLETGKAGGIMQRRRLEECVFVFGCGGAVSVHSWAHINGGERQRDSSP